MGHINDIVTNSQRIKTNITNSFEALKAKGIEISGQETSDDLPSLVESAFKNGGGIAPNGTKWSEATISNNGLLQSPSYIKNIVYGNGIWIALSYEMILSSTDGKKWTPSFNYCYEDDEIYYLGNKFIFVHHSVDDIEYYWSEDGSNWYTIHINTDNDISEFPNEVNFQKAYTTTDYVYYLNNGIYIFNNHNGDFHVTEDIAMDSPTTVISLSYSITSFLYSRHYVLEGNVSISNVQIENNIIYAAVSYTYSDENSMMVDTNEILYSKDGDNWSLVSLFNYHNPINVYNTIYIKYLESGIWVGDVYDYDNTLYNHFIYSYDGISWYFCEDLYTGDGDNDYNNNTSFFTYNGNIYLVKKYLSISKIFKNTNNDWVVTDNLSYGYENNYIISNKIFAINNDELSLGTVSNDNGDIEYTKCILVSENNRNITFSELTEVMEYCCGVYVAGRYDSKGFIYSYNGIKWYTCDTITADVVQIKNANGIWVAGDNAGKLYYSVTWEDN